MENENLNKKIEVVLVDKNDQPLGVMEKIRAHETGALHRAISVVISDGGPTENNPHILIQQRAANKYHAAGLWSNACCSHPLEDEPHLQTAQRRLLEELNLETPLSYCGNFIYRAQLDNGMIEHELDHVYLGSWKGELPKPNPQEVAQLKWVRLEDLQHGIDEKPELYTPWLKAVLECALSKATTNS